MKYYYALSLIFCLFGISLMAQEDSREKYHNNFVGILVSEIPQADFRLSYEHKLNPTHGIKIQAGFAPAYKSYTDATQVDLGLDKTQWCYHHTANWINICAGYRYYFENRKIIYVSGEIFHKTGWSDMIGYTYGLSNSSTITNMFQIKEMRANITGLNILIGKKIRFMYSDSFNMGFDVFAGLSMRYKYLKETVYGEKKMSYYHDEGPPVTIPFYDQPVIRITSTAYFAGIFGVVLYASWY